MPANFHTHTYFCDGDNSPEELVKKAIALGHFAIGFTGHSYTPFDLESGMSPENTEKYIAEVRRLQAAYSDRIEILLGVEQDYYSERVPAVYDYAIASVHSVKKGDKYLFADWSKELTLDIVKNEYGGDSIAFAEDYFSLVGDVIDHTGGDIVGHFDLIRKFDEDGSIFPVDNHRYKKAALAALDRLCRRDPVFEINTGAVVSGYRKTPYPDMWVLQELKDRGMRIMINTDCHDAEYLEFGVPLARAAAKKAGFTKCTVIRNGRFEETDL